jgi:ABC-type amino acid transport substrate-binding protein
VAVSNDYPPFSQVDKAAGERVGWDYDAVREICKRLNCVPEFKTANWYDIFEGKAAGEYDLLADGVPVTEELQQQVDFSIPYVAVSLVLVRSAEPPKTLRFPEIRKISRSGHFIEEQWRCIPLTIKSALRRYSGCRPGVI